MSVAKPASKASRPDRESADSDSDAPSLERRIAEHAKVGVPFAVILGAGVAGLLAGPPAAVLVLTGGALVAVLVIFWASLRLLLGETPLSGADAYALGAPRAEEEQKQAVLRALKDLDFERNVGKISDEDYGELVAKYRAEAKRLLRVLDADAQPRREHVAALVAKRLRRAGLADDAAETDDTEGAAEARPAKRKAGKRKQATAQELAREAEAEGEREAERVSVGETATGVPCASCGTRNDEDAVFCKKCGKKRAPNPPEAATETDDAGSQSGEGT